MSEVGEVEQPKLQLDDAHFERFRCWECRTLWEAGARVAGQGGPSGWLTEAGRSLGPPEACSRAEGGLRSAGWPKPEPARFRRRYRNLELMQREIATAVRADADGGAVLLPLAPGRGFSGGTAARCVVL